jgi:hypothetical protein
MLVWVVIAICWVALLLLLLHDATKEDIGGSAVSIVSGRSIAAALRTLKSLLRWTKSLSSWIAASRKAIAVPKSAAKEATTIPVGSLAHLPQDGQPAQDGRPTSLKQRSTGVPMTKRWRKDRRATITPAELELAIAEAVRKTAPECQDFIGVIVHRRTPKIRLDPNWAVRGVRFGKADRKMVDEALAIVVEQLQQEFRLTEPQLVNQ